MQQQWEIEDFFQPQGYVNSTHSQIDVRCKIGKAIGQYPFNCLCFVSCTSKYSKTKVYGTAFLISHLYGITAAHLLFRKDNHQLIPYDILQVHDPSSGQVMHTQNSGRSVKIVDYRLHPYVLKPSSNWKLRASYDYAVFRLERPLNTLAKYVKIVQIKSQDLRGQIGVTGFPYEKISSTNSGGLVVEGYVGQGKITGANYSYNLFKHNAPTSQGQSGSFVYLRRPSNNLIFGIHSFLNKLEQQKYGIIFTRVVLKQISIWIEQMSTPLFTVCSLQRDKVSFINSSIYYSNVKGTNKSIISQDQKSEKELPQKIGRIVTWDIYGWQEEALEIQGHQITKKNNSNVTILCSKNPFPKYSVQKYRLIVHNLQSKIGIGAVSSSSKIYIEKVADGCTLDNSCFISVEVIKEQNSMLLIKPQVQSCFNPFFSKLVSSGKTGETLILTVDTIDNTIKIQSSYGRLCQESIPEQHRAKGLYLAIGLFAKQDSIKVINQ